MDGTFNAFILILLGAVGTGGAIAYLLDRIPAWKEWKDPLKAWIVLALNGLAIGGLTLAEQYGPGLVANLPVPVQIFIGATLAFYISQITHTQDK